MFLITIFEQKNIMKTKTEKTKIDKKIPKTYKLKESLIKKIELKAKKEDRSPHYMVIKALEGSFK